MVLDGKCYHIWHTWILWVYTTGLFLQWPLPTKKQKTPELLRPTADPPGVVCTGEACSEACRGSDSDAGITELEQNFTKRRRPKKLGQSNGQSNDQFNGDLIV